MIALIMVSWFGGYVTGYSTTTQSFETMAACEKARIVWLEMVDYQTKRGSGYVKATCVVTK